MNRISVIVPTFEHGKTIENCLDNILNQTRQPDEVIVVNDGSTDDTYEKIQPYLDRIKVIHQENMGSNFARNNGFALSTGDLVIFCDADVIMYNLMLEKLEQALSENPEASFAYCGFKFGWKTFSSFSFDPERLTEMNYIHTTSLIRRSDFPGFDQKIKRLQDWDLWLTMIENGRKGVFVNEELFKVVDVRGRSGISQWRPSLMYKIPWDKLGFTPKSIAKYQKAKEIVTKKHGL